MDHENECSDTITSEQKLQEQMPIQVAHSIVINPDPYLVTWNGSADAANPKNWSYGRKWTVTLVVSAYNFMSPISTSIVAPALDSIGADLQIRSDFKVSMVLSIFLLAYAFGPFLIGPLSEIYGRVIVLQLANLFYLIFNTACGFARSANQMIAFRFLAGLGASAPLVIGSGFLADIWDAEERGKALGFYTLAPLLGPAIGPIVGGFITQNTTWRWVFWATSSGDGLIQILGFLCLRETFAPKILGDVAQKLRRRTNDQTWHTKWETPDRSLQNILRMALVRPFILLGTQVIVQVLVIYLAFIFGLMYLVLATFTTIWTGIYHETVGVSGLNYVSLGVGYLLGTLSTAHLNDTIYIFLRDGRGKGIGCPEFRLPLLLPAGVLTPIGLFWYGWSAEKHLHWIMPNIGIAIFGVGVKIGGQCISTYGIDAYSLYIASVGAASIFVYSLFGFGFPIFAPYMYTKLGYGWGNSLLAFIAIVLGLPGPILLWKFGAYLRARSPYAAGDGA